MAYKKDVIKLISEKTGISDIDVELVLRGLSDAIVELVEIDETIHIRGLMNIHCRVRKAFHIKGLNKMSHERVCVKMKTSTTITEKVNEKKKSNKASDSTKKDNQ